MEDWRVGGLDEWWLAISRPLNNTSSSHSGLDPESRKYLITLDTGLRRYDYIAPDDVEVSQNK